MASSFAKLLRYSKFIQLGDFENRLLVGRIVHRVGEDLYIDMGLKHNAVCHPPPRTSEAGKYVVGSQVLVRLHDPELSERFLGSGKDLTLLEADASIIGLYNPKRGDAEKKSIGGSDTTGEGVSRGRRHQMRIKFVADNKQRERPERDEPKTE